MAASRENGVDERLNVGGSIRVKVPVRRLLRMPIRLFPRVGERPAGADMGVPEPRERLLSFLAGDFGFKMDRGRGDALFKGLLKTDEEVASLPLGNAEVEEDLVMRNEVGLKKSLLELSEELALDLLENRSAGSTFSKSSTFRKSATLRFPGDDSAMAADSLALVHRTVMASGRNETSPSRRAHSGTQANSKTVVRRMQVAGRQILTGLLVSRACQALQSCAVKGRERLTCDSCHCAERGPGDRRQTNKQTRSGTSGKLEAGACYWTDAQCDGDVQVIDPSPMGIELGLGGRSVKAAD